MRWSWATGDSVGLSLAFELSAAAYHDVVAVVGTTTLGRSTWKIVEGGETWTVQVQISVSCYAIVRSVTERRLVASLNTRDVVIPILNTSPSTIALKTLGTQWC